MNLQISPPNLRLGDPTEVALVVASQKAGITKTSLENYKFMNEIAFDSDRKRMMVLYSMPEGGAIALVKGKRIF
jgi:Ca2+-transporting ATPase